MMPTAALAVIHHPFFPEMVLTVWNRKYRFWGLPGGKVEPNESPYDACIREALEEVGIHVRIHDQSPVVAVSAVHRPGDVARLVAVFQAHAYAGNPRMCEPGSPIAWMSIDHLIDEDAHPNASFYTEVFSKLVFDR